MQKPHLTLSELERKTLRDFLTKGSMKVRKQTSIKGLLHLDEGKNYQEISKLLGVNYVTVSAWASSYNMERVECNGTTSRHIKKTTLEPSGFKVVFFSK